MSEKRLSRAEMAKQLREEAGELIRLADILEGSGDQKEEAPEPPPRKNGNGITVEQVLKVMKGKMMRKKQVAEILGCQEKNLDDVMTPANGFEAAERGWWRYRG